QCFRTNASGFYYFETFFQAVPCLVRKVVLRDTEQDLVLLFNVMFKQPSIGICLLLYLCGRGLVSSPVFVNCDAKGPHVIAACIMLHKHYPYRPTFPRDSDPLKGRENKFLFLSMVKSIDKDFKEIDQALQVVRPIIIPVVPKSSGNPGQDFQR